MAGMTVAGETFNVVVEGGEKKPALLISNPLGVTLHLWDPLMPDLLKHFRVVRYDSRGHGSSVANDGPYSIAGLGADALAIMDALGVEKAHWLGLSLGALVGQWLLVHAPGRIGRAVLSNAAAQIPGPDLWNGRIEAARKAGMDATAGIVEERWFTRTFRESEPRAVERVMAMLRSTPLHGYTAACAALRDADLREAIRSVANPVLVIVGRHDPSTPPELGAFVAKAIRGAKLTTLDAAHISCIEDQEHFTRAVVEFLTAAAKDKKSPRPRAKSAAKKAAVKTEARKVPPRKTPLQKAPVKKAPAKKAAVKKATAKKAAPVQAAVKKAAKKTLTRKAAAKKTPAKKAPAKAAVVKKVGSKKAASKTARPPQKAKAPTRKSAAKKTVPAKGRRK